MKISDKQNIKPQEKEVKIVYFYYIWLLIDFY